MKFALTALWLLGAAVVSLAAGNLRAADAYFVENHGQYPAHVRFAAPGHPLSPWASSDAVWLMLNTGKEHTTAIRLTLQTDTGPVSTSLAGRTGPAMSFYRGADPGQWLPRLPTRDRLRVSAAGADSALWVSASGSQLQLQPVGDTGTPPVIRVDGAAIESGAGGQPTVVLTGRKFPLPVVPAAGTAVFEGVNRHGQAVSVEARAAAGNAKTAINGGLAYGSFIGSSLADEAEAIHHHAGNIFLTGHTQGISFPATPGPQRASRHVVNAFVTRISPHAPATGYTTLFQGSDQLDGEEYAYALTVNSKGHAFVAGNTNSADFPVTAGAFDTRYGGSIDAFVTRLNGDGTLAFGTYFGSGEFDSVYGLALDDYDNVFVVGGTWSTDLPTTGNAYAGTSQGERDAFVAAFDSSGSSLLYCSYLGGSSQDQAEAVAVDTQGRVHVTGWSRSTDLGTPVTARAGSMPAQATSPFDAFAARLDPAGLSIDYAVTLGGAGEDRGDGIALDGAGRAVLSGLTASADFPVTPDAFDATYGGGTCSFAPCPDAYLAVLDASGQSLQYASYFGGASWDEGRALEVDAAGNITLAGTTHSADLPTAGLLADTSLAGFSDAFVMQLAPGSATLAFSSYLGGSAEDAANALAIDEVGRVYVAGETRSTDFPVTPDAFSGNLAGDYDGFVALFDTGAPDSDGDGIDDGSDNCTLAYNPEQTDSNGDGFGNLCDGDLSGDCTVNFLDLAAMRAVFFSSAADADLNSDGSVNFLDLGLIRAGFFQPPGPSALASCGRSKDQVSR